MRLVPLSNVKDDYKLGKTIYDDQGRVLLVKGVYLKDGLVNRLRELGYSYIYVTDSLSTGEIDDIIKPQKRQKVAGTLSRLMDDMVKLNDEETEKNTTRVYVERMYKNVEVLKDVSSEIVNELMMQKDVMVSLVDIKSTDNFTYTHSVNVALLSLVLGIALSLTRYELYDLALGALLHDVGIILTPKEIARKRKALNDEESKQFELHTRKGYEYLGKLVSIKPVVKVIALEHHEQINGGGYPLGIDGMRINRLAKIIAIADSYDILTSSINGEVPLPPHEALEYLMGDGGTKFDTDMVNQFIKRIVPYPVGTMVKLSSNETGIVSSVDNNFPWRPTVTIIKEGRLDRSINLLEAKNITIVGIQYAL